MSFKYVNNILVPDKRGTGGEFSVSVVNGSKLLCFTTDNKNRLVLVVEVPSDINDVVSVACAVRTANQKYVAGESLSYFSTTKTSDHLLKHLFVDSNWMLSSGFWAEAPAR
jgi:hypothetical protein